MKLSLSLKTNSSQRWAGGAVGLALLFACSPKAPDAPQPTEPPPQGGPQLSEPQLPPSPINATPAVAPEAPPPLAPVVPPGFAGNWATSEAECSDPAKLFELSAETINIKPMKQACQVKSISEEHPTGRSMIYTVEADCMAQGQPTHETIKLNFGASDTVMQFVLGKHEPVRLTRCP